VHTYTRIGSFSVILTKEESAHITDDRADASCLSMTEAIGLFGGFSLFRESAYRFYRTDLDRECGVDIANDFFDTRLFVSHGDE
jgi:hypothetical protein